MASERGYRQVPFLGEKMLILTENIFYIQRK